MEKITTVRLEINGEPAKNTLDELRQRAEVLSQKISAIKILAQSGGNESLMSNVYGLMDPKSKELERLVGVIDRLEKRLQEPSMAIVSVTGDNGIEKAEREYKRLVNNARPKNRRT